MASPLKIIFAGTPEFAAHHLQALLNSEHQVIAVYTQPDRPAGRGQKLTPSAVKVLAQESDLPVLQPVSLKTEEAQAELSALGADLMVVVAYGLLLPKAVLDAPRLGCINVHGSLLPRWRGAAPIQRAVLNGDKTSGVTIMQMDIGLDTGHMLLKAECPIDTSETSASLYAKLQELGPVALIDALSKFESLTAEPQREELANYAAKLTKAEAELDWQQPAEVLERQVRGFNPWPTTNFQVENQRVKVHQAEYLDQQTDQAAGTIVKADKQGIDIATSNGILRLISLQPPGKKTMAAHDILNARSQWFTVGKQLQHSTQASS